MSDVIEVKITDKKSVNVVVKLKGKYRYRKSHSKLIEEYELIGHIESDYIEYINNIYTEGEFVGLLSISITNYNDAVYSKVTLIDNYIIALVVNNIYVKSNRSAYPG